MSTSWVSESISINILDKANRYFDFMDAKSLMEEPKSLKKYARLTGYSTLHIVCSLAALVEGVVRALFALLGKVFTFFIPKQYAQTLDKAVETLATSALLNLANVPFLGFSAIALYLSEETSDKWMERCLMLSMVDKAIEKRIHAFSTRHINGSY